MGDRSTREFAERMRHVRLEDEARERILDNVTARSQAEKATSQQDPRQSRQRRSWQSAKPLTRNSKPCAHKRNTTIIAGVAACALAASIGVVGLTSLDGSSSSALLGGQKAFALEAYAQGDLGKEPYHTTTLTENALISNVGGCFGHWQDLETGEVLKNTLGYWFRFDLTCIGNEVASYTYEIEGDGAYFGIIDSKSETPAVLNKYHIVEKTLTIDTDNQNDYGTGEGARYIPGIIVSLPMDEEFAATYEAARNADASQSEALVNKMEGENAPENEKVDSGALEQALNEAEEELRETGCDLDRLIEKSAASRISECKLRVTATYVDGTTETKTYAISPVDNYDALMESFLAEREAWMTKIEADPDAEESFACPENPELYTITEIKE